MWATFLHKKIEKNKNKLKNKSQNFWNTGTPEFAYKFLIQRLSLLINFKENIFLSN